MINFNAGVLTISDKEYQGQRMDDSGDYIVKTFQREGIPVARYEVIPDDGNLIARTLAFWADSGEVDLIVTTGGTGLGPRDVTPEATRSVLTREIPGIAEIMRIDGFHETPTAILSRGVAGSRGQCLIINLPGSPGAVQEYLDLIMPVIPHAIETLQGRHSNNG
ncbi:MAG: MogA/MoaB family molybdenum cofactor biosynthesis protein [Dehalococcoidia bacterium]|nr:MogA/MoaB family molybdenum cofactor biosynthesis protein [Dehalococcoidia bacterium]MDD5495143.1 MogA/MoaB family molybdenum cofactor biosynthesis protein [Dehalococcoidia bacterium]